APTSIPQAAARSQKAYISFYLAVSSYLLTIITLVAVILDPAVLGAWCLLLTILTSVPALIYGLLSLRDIRRTGGGRRVKNLAFTGLLLSFVGSLASGCFVLHYVNMLQLGARKAGMG